MVNSFLKVSVKTCLFPDYVLDDALDDEMILQTVIMVLTIVMMMKIIELH